MSLSERLYARLPTIGQHAAVSTYGVYWQWLRFGPGYDAARRAYLQREHFDTVQWRAWTQDRLRRLLTDCARHVPYYRDTWNGDQRNAAEDGHLEAIPMLEKEPLRADPHAFVRTDRRSPRTMVFHTSGSTGTPIACIWTVGELRNSLALREARSAAWAGTSFRRSRATFSGRTVVPNPHSTGPFHRFNLAERQVYFSAFHLSATTAPHYVAALRNHRVRWLTGYAVSFHLLARHILEQGLEVPTLDAIITTSEKLTESMRTEMEAAYGCRVFEEYSTVENAVFASECPEGRLHVSPDAGVVEIVRPDGTACVPGEPGEVVATCLMRDHQPLIRFRLGDVATWALEPCPCGRTMPVLAEVVGRTEDVVVGPDGRAMVRFHGIFVDLPAVREGQIVQEALDHIRVRVVPTPSFGASDEQLIIARVRQRLGDKVAVTVELVDTIARSAAGKFRAVISHLGDKALS